MNMLTCPDQVTKDWRGTCCSKILKKSPVGEDFLKYLESLQHASIDPKHRFHYYVKSYIVPFVVKSIGCHTVLHIGFGENERYPRGYHHFGINFLGCELPIGTSGSWYKHKSNSLKVLEKDFLNWQDEDFRFLANIDPSKMIVVTEATLYYFLFHNDFFRGRHVSVDKETCMLLNDLRITLERFVAFGVRNFLFIEPRNQIFEEIAGRCGLSYGQIELAEDLKYDFLLDYTRFRDDNDFFPVAHVISDNSIPVFEVAKKVLGDASW